MKITRKVLIIMAVLSTLFGACTGTKVAYTPTYQKIEQSEALAIMQSEADFILLDVRTEAEYKEVRIPGAILLPDTQIASRAADILPDKDALILVYCRSGRRSAAAAKQLVAMGYINIRDFGGIIDWTYDLVSG